MGVSSPDPLGGRAGWTGDSGGYITTVAQLPAAANGQNIQLRWRFGADNNTAPAGGGWDVDTVKVNGSYTCTIVDHFTRSPFDFDGDNKTDISIFRQDMSRWWISRSSDNAVAATALGFGDDIVVPADYTGDGKADIAVWHAVEGKWYIIRSEDGFVFLIPVWSERRYSDAGRL